MFFIFFFLFQVFATARVVLVSDVDDTIKVSHVLDPDSAIGNALKTGNVFRGMPYLYAMIGQYNRGAAFFYLTNAPQLVFDRVHGRFLMQNDFPGGYLLLRRDIRDKEHKIRNLREIVSYHRGSTFVLIGDNGERDPAFYHQIRQEFPSERFIVFIREAYSSQHDEADDRGMRLFPGQIGFVTPLEIALKLEEEGLFHPELTEMLEQHYVPITLQNAIQEDRNGETGVLSFPNWIDCRDFQIPMRLRMRQTQLTQALVKRIEYRCSIPPFDD